MEVTFARVAVLLLVPRKVGGVHSQMLLRTHQRGKQSGCSRLGPGRSQAFPVALTVLARGPGDGGVKACVGGWQSS